jgi:sulfatase maturation enzyme AslB (radical SAM superfamily)
MNYWNPEMFQNTRRVNQALFDRISLNIKNFSKLIQGKSCDLGVNYIITKENHDTLLEAFDYLVSLGMDNIRFSPLWVPDFYAYHQPIENKLKNN